MAIANGSMEDAADVLKTLNPTGYLQSGTHANRPATPVVGQHYIETDANKFCFCAVAGAWIELVTASLVTASSATLGADVDMASANTWYDAVSLSLVAGTYIIQSCLSAYNSHASGGATGVRIYNDTDAATLASSQASGAQYITSSIAPMVYTTLSGTKTIKLQGSSTQTGNDIKAALISNGVGNNATVLIAIKIA